MKTRSLLAVAAATAFLACSGSDSGGPTEPGPPQENVFAPTADTELSGAVEFDEVSIPAGVTVRVTSDLTLTVAGPIEIAGDLVGDCVGIDLVGSAEVTINGRIANVCGMPVDGAPGINITGDGEMVFDGATIESAGDIASRNDPSLSFELELENGALRPAQDDTPPMILVNSVFESGNGSLREDANGETVEAESGGFGGKIVKSSRSSMIFNGGVALVTGDGGRGGGATAQSATAAEATGGQGGAAGIIALSATSLRFTREAGGRTLLKTGNGGRGGDARAEGLENPGSETAASALAGAGSGGDTGSVLFVPPPFDDEPPGVEVAQDALRVELGQGGRGGDAIAIGADGVDATLSRAAQRGGFAGARAGRGGGVLILNVPREVITGGHGGRGGDASATAGEGGDGMAGAFPDGADGGNWLVSGGRGGDLIFKGNDPARSFLPAQETDAMIPGDGGDAHLTGAGGGVGADRCGDAEAVDAEGDITVKDDPAGSDGFVFGAAQGAAALALHIVTLTPSGRGGDGGKGGGGDEVFGSGGGRGGVSAFQGAEGASGRTVLDEAGNGGPAGRGTPPGDPGLPGDPVGLLSKPRLELKEPIFLSGATAAPCESGALVPAQDGTLQITISGDAPWIEVTGTLAEDGTVTAEGTGTMVGVQGIKATFEGTFTDGRLQGDYAMDTGKKIDPDHPIVYAVDVQRQ